MQKHVTNPPLDRSALLRASAASYAAVALAHIGREFPADVWHIVHGPDDLPGRPRDRTPVFYGSYDWHSSVEMHWLLVRLLRAVPEAIPAGEIRAVLESRFDAAALAAEARFIADPDNRNPSGRTGGDGASRWSTSLAAWDDPDARRWSARFDPLRQALAGNFLGWLPLATLRPPFPTRWATTTWSTTGWPPTRCCSCPETAGDPDSVGRPVRSGRGRPDCIFRAAMQFDPRADRRLSFARPARTIPPDSRWGPAQAIQVFLVPGATDAFERTPAP